MEVIKKYKAQIRFHFLLNLVFAAFVTFASFIHVPLNSYEDHFIYLAYFLTLQFSVFGFLYLLSINRWIFMLLFPLLFMACAITAYWVYVQDIAISQNLIQVALETKSDIVFDLISLPFIMYLLASILCVALMLYYHRSILKNQLKSPLFLLAIVAVLSCPVIEDIKLGVFSRRLPFNIAFSARDYFRQNNLNLKPISKQLEVSNNPLSIVFILGESVRADHMQLNGYARNTNPLLSKRQNIISFPNAYTPNTYTAISVPQIFTDAELTDDYSNTKYSLIDVLNHAHIETNWIGNQTPEKSYEIFIQQSKFNTIIDPLHTEMSFQKDYDAQMLPVFKKVFSGHKNQFTTLHMMGSHWWYETRYPESFRQFKPVIQSKHIPSNSTQEMLNSYDNTLVYTDYFINETIKHVEKEKSNTLVIYLSDHGETLGENGMWLHAQSGKESMNPALVIWYSDQFYEKNPAIVRQLQANKTKKIGLDFFFQSILDLYKIKGIPYEKSNLIYQ
jgi:glucan phosphoethanolaminetransferase (alkaline phosphatase superfamily)